MTNAFIIIILLAMLVLTVAAYSRLGDIRNQLEMSHDSTNGQTYILKEIRNNAISNNKELKTAVDNLGDNLGDSLRQTREDMNNGTAAIIQFFTDMADKTENEPAPLETSEPDGTVPNEETEPAPNEEPSDEVPETLD